MGLAPLILSDLQERSRFIRMRPLTFTELYVTVLLLALKVRRGLKD